MTRTVQLVIVRPRGSKVTRERDVTLRSRGDHGSAGREAKGNPPIRPRPSSSTRILGPSVRMPTMSFGQLSGPPASARQVRELLALLNGAGHSDFRDARGPMGFTQRQAAGKFSRDEATAFIDQLQQAEWEQGAALVTPAQRPSAEEHAHERLLGGLPSEQLARELRRRGWTVVEP